MEPTADQKADAFVADMTGDLLGENFTLKTISFTPGEGEFEKIAGRDLAFRNFVNDRMLDLACQECAMCATTYIDRFESGLLGAHALALWFFRFDEDNWFSFERVLEKTRAYLDGVSKWNDRLELRLFKGFSLRGILTEAISGPDLPVVVNYGDKTITIISCELRD